MGNWRLVVTAATVLVSIIFTVNASIHPDVNSRLAAISWLMVMLFWWGWDMSLDLRMHRRMLERQAKELIEHRRVIESLCDEMVERSSRSKVT
jgi:hypothetical protein